MNDVELKELILGCVKDLVVDFLYYDRKDDGELPAELLEDAMQRGVVTKDELVQTFSDALNET